MTMSTTALGGGGETRRERRKREVHDRIVEAAIALFERQGFAEHHRARDRRYRRRGGEDLLQPLPHQAAPDRGAGARARWCGDRRSCSTRARPGATPRERLQHFFERAADEAESGSRRLARELILEWIRVSQVDNAEDRRLHEAFAALFAGEGSARERDFLADMAVATYTGILINWVSRSDYPLRERLLAAARLLCAAVPKKESR